MKPEAAIPKAQYKIGPIQNVRFAIGKPPEGQVPAVAAGSVTMPFDRVKPYLSGKPMVRR